MKRTRDWRLTCIALGDAPPLVPALLTRLPGAVWSARTLDAFLTELDAGGEQPDAVLAFGGDELIRALRSHDRTCVLPVFLFAAADQAAPPGWDGTWSDEEPAALADMSERTEWIHALPAPAAPLDSMRREHRFARWLSARGHCQLADAEVFGLDAPRSTMSTWQARAWVSAPAKPGAAWLATDALRAAASEAVLALPEIPAPAPDAGGTAAALAPGAQAPLPRSALLALSAFLVVLAALIWGRGLELLPTSSVGEEGLARQPNLQIGGARPPADPGVKQTALPQSAAFRTAERAAPAAAAAAAPAVAPLRTVTRGVLWRGTSPLRALAAGRVTALLAAPGAWLTSGAPLARLRDPRAEQEVTRLEEELRQVDETIAAGSRDDAQARSLANTQGELEERRLSGEIAGAAARTAQAQDLYERNLKLAEEGVISFREVRPDWNALQQARATEAQARGLLDAFLAARGANDSGADGAAPAWLEPRRARLEDALRAARALAAPRMLLAAAAGEMLSWQVAIGDVVEEGAELAQISAGDAWVEVRLAAGEPRPAGGFGEVEIRLSADGPWLAAAEFHEVLSPGAGALLRARVPPEQQAAARTGAAAELRFLALD